LAGCIVHKFEARDAEGNIGGFVDKESPYRQKSGFAVRQGTGTWHLTDADMAEADGRLAIFPIVVRGAHSLQLLGTGFYLQPHGGFATAAHVALEAEQHLAAAPGSVGIGRRKMLCTAVDSNCDVP